MMIFLALPAEAHHPGGGGNTGSGGPINTISADTLSEGLIAASVRYEFIRLGQLSDADLHRRRSEAARTRIRSARSTPSRFRSPTASPTTSPLAFAPPASAARISANPAEDMLSGGHMGIMNANDMSSLMSPDGINRRGNSAGFGDVTMLGQYRFHNNAQTGTSAAVLFGFKAPTGSTSQRDNFGNLFEAEFQPGSGSWDGLFGAAFTKRTGRWSFDVSGLYYLITNGTRTPISATASCSARPCRIAWSAPPARRRRSELHEYCMQPRNQLQEHCLYHANHDHSDMMKTPYTLDLVLELNGEWHDKQRIAGIPDPNSGGTTVYLSPGVRVGFDRFSGFVSVGVPVLNQHNGVQSKPDFRVLTGIGARLN